MRRVFSLLAAALLAGGLAVVGAGTASAHNVLVSSDPKDGQSLETGPAEITLVFDQPVQAGDKFNTISVQAPDGTRWEDAADPVVRDNSVIFKVRTLGPAAEYRVDYRILSADGHSVTGDLKFTTTKEGGGTPAPTAAAEQDSGGGGGVPIWVWIAGAVVLLGGGVFFALRGGGREPAGR